jgi:hypothetical protein
MQSGGWVELLRLLPEKQHANLILMTADASEVAVQNLIRLEADYVVLRGRVAGTSDTGLIFFIPYDRIVFARFQKLVPEEMVYRLYGMTPPEAKPAEAKPECDPQAAEAKPDDPAKRAGGAPPTHEVNCKDLLDRLRSRVHHTGGGKDTSTTKRPR